MKEKILLISRIILCLFYALFAGIWIHIFLTGTQFQSGELSLQDSQFIANRAVVRECLEYSIYILFEIESLFIWMANKGKDNSIVQFGCAMFRQILLMIGTGFIAAAVSFALRLGGYMNFFEPCIVALYLLLINLIVAFFARRRKRNRSLN